MDKKGGFLASNLIGSGQMVLQTLLQENEGQGKGYPELELACDSGLQPAISLSWLEYSKELGRKKEETPPELAEDLCSRFLAYPDTCEDFKDKPAMNQFINAQLNLDFQVKISRRKPKTLQETEAALRTLGKLY